MIRNRKIVRGIAVYLLIQFTSSIVVPSVSYALTSGPSQPEFSSFEPVATTNMVDEFSGDFTYNLSLLEVPGPHGSGYPISLSYHSGVTPEEESSWVGYGWTLNAGAINRDMRGVPDDYKGQNITMHNKMPKNWTATAGAGVGFGEIFGVDLSSLGASLSASASLRYNNNRGFGYNTGIGLTLGRGLISMGYNVSDGDKSYSLSLNPTAILNWRSGNPDVKKDDDANITTKTGAPVFPPSEPTRREKAAAALKSFAMNTASLYGKYTFTDVTRPNVVGHYEGKSFNVTVGVEGNPVIVPVGGTVDMFGSYSFQKNIPEENVRGYGYLYSADATKNDLMDYHVEQEKDFNKRDVVLGIPFNDADNYNVTGEGIGGGFRLHHRIAGHFGPRNVSSHTDIYNVGGEIGAGWTFGPGVDVGKGDHTLEVKDWERELSSFMHASSPGADEPVFFRFNNDLGGEWGSNYNDEPFRAMVSGSNVSLPLDAQKYSMTDERSGRSSYIGWHTNLEMVDEDGNPTPEAYSKIRSLNTFFDRRSAEYADLIGELSVVNEAGNRYVYGLPVHARNEKNLSFSAKGAAVEKRYMAYANSPNTDVKLGQEQAAPYATTYLLTEITTPDYVDRGGLNSGPSPDDLGGYTRFNYQLGTAGGTGVFTWRAPFKGMLYKKNSHSDPLDDLVSYAEGQKDIYYLDYVETKTHVAFFRTSPRKDGKEAQSNAFRSDAGAGNKRLEKLDRIDLYLVADCKRTDGVLERPSLEGTIKPIKTVHLKYDTSLTTKVPNGEDDCGKLTLKRVYFEYNGVQKTVISPYDFQYAYPNYTTYPDLYKPTGSYDVTKDHAQLTADDQNPSYSFFLNDPWGNYQEKGEDRFNHMRSWVNQDTSRHFDPAAWHLKVIKLPSGGEIHVQYEQDDYNFVQDQEAHAMVPLSSVNLNQYVIDHTAMGWDADDLEQARKMIQRRYVEQGHKIYFRFLYKLVEALNWDPLESCNAEYITGYASVTGCGISNGKIFIMLKLDQRLPEEICKDFVKIHRLGKVYGDANCDPSRGMSDPSDPKAMVSQLLNLAVGVSVPSTLCNDMDKTHSYFRLPMPKAKKGGGVRVKRLMMFDKGLEADPVLYGNEYLYTQQDADGRTISSGVATNEPVTMHEENILVDFVARKGQTVWNRIIAGKDREESEAPFGETVLPGPAIGYAKVVTRNIYHGTTEPGFGVSEFYTARDFPIHTATPQDAETMTTIKRTDDNPFPLKLPFLMKIKTKTSAAQGFNFIVNNMHGQPKSKSAYQGAYTENLATAVETSGINYEYFNPNDKIPVMSSAYGGIEYKNPGREVDVTFAQRKVTESSNDVNGEFDLQLTVIPLAFIVLIIPYPTSIPAFSSVEGELNTHGTTKVVRYPSILKKTTIRKDGIAHTEENLAFDNNTGKAVAIRSTDEFKGAYLTQNIPASWEYPDMGGKWQSEGKKLAGTFSLTQNTINLGSDLCNLAMFARGDELRLGGNGSTARYFVTGRDYLNNGISVEPAQGATTPTGQFDEILILRSGRTNQLQAQAGAITMHNENKDAMTPPATDEATRYNTADDFATALKAALKTVGAEARAIPVAGTFSGMDMSAFADRMSDCGSDLTNATITNVTIRCAREANGIRVQLVKFDIFCTSSNSNVTVRARGWTE